MRIYIAGGWFTPEQERALEEVLDRVKELDFDFYSPRDDMLYIPSKTSAKEVMQENCRQIEEADFIIASTEGKDMGTVWECGYAYAVNIPIIYYFGGKGKFNLMLSESGHAVCTTSVDLYGYLSEVKLSNKVIRRNYTGELE